MTTVNSNDSTWLTGPRRTKAGASCGVRSRITKRERGRERKKERRKRSGSAGEGLGNATSSRHVVSPTPGPSFLFLLPLAGSCSAFVALTVGSGGVIAAATSWCSLGLERWTPLSMYVQFIAPLSIVHPPWIRWVTHPSSVGAVWCPSRCRWARRQVALCQVGLFRRSASPLRAEGGMPERGRAGKTAPALGFSKPTQTRFRF